MAQQHLNTVLTAAGIEQAEIDKIIALPAEDTTFKPDDYVGKIYTTAETKVKNDPKFWEGLDENNVNETLKKKIESQQYGRANNIVRQKVMKVFGLKDEDLADMTEEEKKSLETFVTKSAEKYTSTKTTAPQVQKELIEARTELEKLKAEIPVNEGKLKTALETEYNNKNLDFIILAELSTIPDLKAPAQYLLANIAAQLKEENAFVINGHKALPKQKANPALDVLDGAKVLTLKDLIIKKLTADGLIGEPAASGKQSGSSKVEVTPDGTGKLAISPHIMEQIEKNKPATV